MAQSTTWASHSMQRRAATMRQKLPELPYAGELVAGQPVNPSVSQDPAWRQWIREDKQ